MSNEDKTLQTSINAPLTGIPVSMNVELNFESSNLNESDKQTITKIVRNKLFSNEIQNHLRLALFDNLDPVDPDPKLKKHPVFQGDKKFIFSRLLQTENAAETLSKFFEMVVALAPNGGLTYNEEVLANAYREFRALFKELEAHCKEEKRMTEVTPVPEDPIPEGENPIPEEETPFPNEEASVSEEVVGEVPEEAAANASEAEAESIISKLHKYIDEPNFKHAIKTFVVEWNGEIRLEINPDCVQVVLPAKCRKSVSIPSELAEFIVKSQEANAALLEVAGKINDVLADTIELKLITRFNLDNPQIAKIVDQAADIITAKVTAKLNESLPQGVHSENLEEQHD